MSLTDLSLVQSLACLKTVLETRRFVCCAPRLSAHRNKRPARAGAAIIAVLPYTGVYIPSLGPGATDGSTVKT